MTRASTLPSRAVLGLVGALALALAVPAAAQDAKCAKRLQKLAAHVDHTCCTAGVGCGSGTPDRCTPDCAAMWMPFYRKCSAFAAENLGDLQAFSHECTNTLYGTGGKACDAEYLTLGLKDVSLACGCASPDCGLRGASRAFFGEVSARCAAEFETVHARCADFVTSPAAGVDAARWAGLLARCEAAESGPPEADGSCEGQCAARFAGKGQAADACACAYGCRAAEGGDDSAACLARCDTQCDDEGECACGCGAAGTCGECTADDECEEPCAVGCSMLTDATQGFSGLAAASAALLDAAEENVQDGAMYLGSSDLELMADGHEQVVNPGR
jgi:hypothetical protein